MNRLPYRALLLSFLAIVTGACAAPDLEAEAPTSGASSATETGTISFTLPPIFPTCETTPRTVKIDPKSRKPNADELYFLMWASTVAYGDKDQIILGARAAGFTRVEFLDKGPSGKGFQAYIATRPGLRVLSFRGSSEDKDWIQNAKDFTVNGKDLGLPGRVHAGDAEQFSEGLPLVKKALKELGESAAPLWITGHSLGGALATLFGVHFAGMAQGVVTFAAPRAGDSEFAEEARAKLGTKYTRVTRPDDLVPRVPPAPVSAQAFASFDAFGETPENVKSRAAYYEQTHYQHIGRALELNVTDSGIAPTVASADDGDLKFFRDLVVRAKAESTAASAPATAKGEVVKSIFAKSHGAETYACTIVRSLTRAPGD